MADLRRPRRDPRPAWAGVAVPRSFGNATAIVAALLAVTTLAALQLGSRPEGLPDFVANALGEPRQADAPIGEWRTFENGVSRRTPWGHETIAYGGARPEKYITVSERQGVRVWRWRIAANEAGARPSRPVRVLDETGRALPDKSLSWSLTKRGDAWLVHLRVVDSNLPLPYVLEPVTTAQRGVR